MIVCIGAFDGYHRGHFCLFNTARELARAQKSAWTVVTFAPHPRFVLGNGLKARLFSEEEKERIRQVFSIPDPLEIPFTPQLASTEPGVFLDALDQRLGISGIVVGQAFHFGKNRSGDSDFLLRYCSSHGWQLRLVPQQIMQDGSTISSSRIRELIQGGDVTRANTLLGYPFFIISQVVTGEQRGRDLGYPTANILPGDMKLIPMEGVYAGAAWQGGRWWPAAVSVGRNPTFNVNGNLRIESHLIGFQGNLYGERLTLAFLDKLRPITRYSGRDELIEQLRVDCSRTEEIFQHSVEHLMPFYQLPQRP